MSVILNFHRTGFCVNETDSVKLRQVNLYLFELTINIASPHKMKYKCPTPQDKTTAHYSPLQGTVAGGSWLPPASGCHNTQWYNVHVHLGRVILAGKIFLCVFFSLYIKGPVLAIMLCAPLLLFWFSRERGVHCY